MASVRCIDDVRRSVGLTLAQFAADDLVSLPRGHEREASMPSAAPAALVVDDEAAFVEWLLSKETSGAKMSPGTAGIECGEEREREGNDPDAGMDVLTAGFADRRRI